MYIPRLNRMTDLDTMTAFMQQHNFAIVVSAVDNIPVATHLPFTIARSEDNLRLRSHFAKANPQWQTITESDTLVIFPAHTLISRPHTTIKLRAYQPRITSPSMLTGEPVWSISRRSRMRWKP